MLSLILIPLVALAVMTSLQLINTVAQNDKSKLVYETVKFSLETGMGATCMMVPREYFHIVVFDVKHAYFVIILDLWEKPKIYFLANQNLLCVIVGQQNLLYEM